MITIYNKVFSNYKNNLEKNVCKLSTSVIH